jgi:hypothetical protein
MSTYTMRIAMAVVAGLGISLAAPVAAQEWRIYTLGKADPIEANFYAEEVPWVFYKFADDPSMYVYAVGCNRITRVERGGQAIPRPACPVEIVPENQTRVISTLLDLEAKRLDETFERLRGITVQFNRAAADAVITLAGARQTGERIPTATLAETLNVLNQQLDEVRSELQLSLNRSEAVANAFAQYRLKEREAVRPQRYFFSPR